MEILADCEAIEGPGRLHRELPVGLVDEDLGDRDRVGTAVDDVELDLVPARAESPAAR